MRRRISTVLIVAGALLLADAGITLLWQEPLSALYASREQGQLADQLATLERQRLTAEQRSALDRLRGDDRRIAFLARSLNRRAKEGEPLGRIRMNRIGVNTVFVAGTKTETLRKGPGHYPQTPLPGMPGTTAIAGHRTTYGAPFRKIDKLRKRDKIVLTLPYGVFTYEVERKQIVPPTAVEVTRRVSYDRLVLSACHPLYSAAQRIIVFARLVDVEPRGAALVRT